ncbi:unnamed protein product [Paramecium pentaurelia]|uniref:RRM domain-containing protein n=1 Tax=Paramecium pentaurelia TaxID=43138 RepID=A0A8S1S1W0_9CILI|nr:unnamed protein product [Paramecium pentaurelia]
MSKKEDIIEINLEEKIQQNKRNKQNVRKGYQEKRQKIQAFFGDRHRNDDRNPGAIVDITNLHYSVTNDELKELAQQFGKVRKAQVEWDKMGRSLEQGYIEFFYVSDAKKAVESLNNTTIESLPMKAQLRDSTIRRGMFKR